MESASMCAARRGVSAAKKEKRRKERPREKLRRCRSNRRIIQIQDRAMAEEMSLKGLGSSLQVSTRMRTSLSLSESSKIWA